ncbi:electron transport complex subunit RsxG [Shewanella sp. WXL01]|uniref:electron transport complex subunit RsxG n=1 Tax=Shewanella sp. WXL01 TaxID=2709721 RepID=UPI00143825F0|nr:electron transport complex subunit RsxG [Shewanella sp. WXL01]NKF50444.1 electron transport complex subunit RsxG [Shewanella sp. WXL01]
MVKNGTILAIFALLCTGLVAVISAMTEDTIEQQQKLQLTKLLAEVVPENMHDNPLTEHCILVHDPELLGNEQPMPAYVATIDGEPTALALEVIAPAGYNGDIKILIGVDSNNTLLGVRTLAHQETPGLGDKIELRKSDWVLQFSGWIYDNTKPALKVKKDGGDIDQFSGATITPRAYLGAINNAMRFVEQNRTQLYRAPINCEAHDE